MNVPLPEPSVFEEIALETNIAASFIEKDWYVTQLIAALSAIKIDGFELIFTGGTALAKAHGLLQRFSEDIDFRVLTENTNRKTLSKYKHAVIDELRENGFQIKDYQTKARDGNKYFAIDLDYETQFTRLHTLRPHVQIELFVRPIQLSPIYLPVNSFVADLSGHAPEVQSIGCINPVEIAADKLSALAWRIPDRIRGDVHDDPAVIRHLHDLAALEQTVKEEISFKKLVLSSMSDDNTRSKNSDDFSRLSANEKFDRMMRVFKEDEANYQQEYRDFVEGVSYAPEGETPSYQGAVTSVKGLIEIITS